MKNAQLKDLHLALERKYYELDLLYQIEKEISYAQAVENLLDSILAKCLSIVGAEAGSVLLLDEDEGRLFFKSTAGEKGEEVKRLRVRIGEGIVGWVTEHGEAIISNAAAGDPRHSRAISDQIGYAPRNILCVPLVYGERALSAIELLNKTGGRDHRGRRLTGRGAGGQGDRPLRPRGEKRDERLAIGQLLEPPPRLQDTDDDHLGYVQLLAMEPTRPSGRGTPARPQAVVCSTS